MRIDLTDLSLTGKTYWYLQYFLYPDATSMYLEALDELQAALDPPYSDGFLMCEIQVAFIKSKKSVFTSLYKGFGCSII